MEMFPNEVRTRKIRISYGLIWFLVYSVISVDCKDYTAVNVVMSLRGNSQHLLRMTLHCPCTWLFIWGKLLSLRVAVILKREFQIVTSGYF
jgi:hypothetical protein